VLTAAVIQPDAEGGRKGRDVGGGEGGGGGRDRAPKGKLMKYGRLLPRLFRTGGGGSDPRITSSSSSNRDGNSSRTRTTSKQEGLDGGGDGGDSDGARTRTGMSLPAAAAALLEEDAVGELGSVALLLLMTVLYGSAAGFWL